MILTSLSGVSQAQPAASTTGATDLKASAETIFSTFPAHRDDLPAVPTTLTEPHGQVLAGDTPLPDLLPNGSLTDLAALKQHVEAALGSLDVSSLPNDVSSVSAIESVVHAVLGALEKIDELAGSQFVAHLEQAVAQLGAKGEDILSNLSPHQSAWEALAAISRILQVATPHVPIDKVNSLTAWQSPASDGVRYSPLSSLSLNEFVARVAQPTQQSQNVFSLPLPDVDAALQMSPGRAEGQTFSVTSPSQSDPAQLRHSILRQISQTELPMPIHEMGRTRLELTPAGLGRLELEIETFAQSGLRVVLRADNPLVLEALRMDRSGLEAALSGSGGYGAQQEGGRAFDFEAFQGPRKAPDEIVAKDEVVPSELQLETVHATEPRLPYGPMKLDIVA